MHGNCRLDSKPGWPVCCPPVFPQKHAQRSRAAPAHPSVGYPFRVGRESRKELRKARAKEGKRPALAAHRGEQDIVIGRRMDVKRRPRAITRPVLDVELSGRQLEIDLLLSVCSIGALAKNSIAGPPCRSEANRISFPSGDHAGSMSFAAFVVSRVVVPVRMSISQRSRLPRSPSGRSKSRRPPSGELRGSKYTPGGPSVQSCSVPLGQVREFPPKKPGA